MTLQPYAHNDEQRFLDSMSRPIYAIDLCCGVGGFTAGLRQAGIQVLGGVDNDPYPSAIYEQNFNLPVCPIDICKATAWDICTFFRVSPNIIDLVVAAPTRLRRASKSSVDPREQWSQLLWSCARLIAELRPRLFVLEYPAPRFKLHGRIIDEAVDLLRRGGYYIHHSALNALHYGVPQHRLRHYYVGQRDDHYLPFIWPSPTVDDHAMVQMWDAISDLPPPPGKMDAAQDLLHRGLTDLKRARLHAALAGDGAWSQNHRAPFGKVRRLHPDQPVPQPGITATFTQLSGFESFVHPFEDRTLTLREGARLQTFHDDFKFLLGNKGPEWTKLEELIGRATPPRLAASLGRALADHLELETQLPAIGRRNVTQAGSASWGLLGQYTFQLLPTPSPELRYFLRADPISAPDLVSELLRCPDYQVLHEQPSQMELLQTQEVWWSSQDRVEHAIERYQDMLQMCELIGLCYQDADRHVHVTPFGALVLRRLDRLNEQNSRLLCSYAVHALAASQIDSPVRQLSDVTTSDVFPFICIWRALLALDDWLSTEELNRVLFQVMTMEQLELAIQRIAAARSTQDVTQIGPPAIPPAQAVSHVHTWMSLASFGWTLITPEYVGIGVWRYHVRPTMRSLLKGAVRRHPRTYTFSTVQDYVTYVAQAAGVPKDMR